MEFGAVIFRPGEVPFSKNPPHPNFRANRNPYESSPVLIWQIQDKFDHDKGQKSAISGRRLHWRLSTGFFAFFQYLCAI